MRFSRPTVLLPLHRIALALAVVLATGGSGIAPSADEVRAVQYALSIVRRYHPGPVDGLPGPLTYGAVDTYAYPRPLESEFWTVAAHLKSLVWWRIRWTPEIDTAVKEAIVLANGGRRSSLIRERVVWQTTDGTAACARVRTREGDRWLHFTLKQVLEVPRGGGQPRSVLRARGPAAIPRATSALWCALGYVPPPSPNRFAK